MTLLERKREAAPLTPKQQQEMYVRVKRTEQLIYKLAHALGVTFAHETTEVNHEDKPG